ncbi:ABC transporter ATP-binding protein [Sulfitobacter sp. M57]|uniref:ABC transporter ATP-binding protein n=1 Tax=unclassified Sulfitobacter TaxID=196795 RepID=UPI0023E264DF|nr:MULTISPECIES: ABC transporter ATP-binding protein [unclassified Sulfitobacter]MDF3414648.1 ABC transporter ATP-binding protein [Sulfitobacter sp. KE5]MDF3422130.1 ABC transporter ATP-binding protein [Sulfitobacter sp. KE43]MDF3433195.1 ABC transporter ATP-binding protein [Sulfitobacter sp. KE42]MDF3458835.1 ABC transporter ATP-binding protein [Sulfitobacter sp. S74]MDF3462734.1 ABC transporter ATP-binding protein [Sulfitobacter sp. Ks18]
MTGLYVNDLTFAYGTRKVLTDLSFAPLEPGKLTALIGPNAAGKSTLFRLIAGLSKPEAGRVVLNGLNLATLSTRERLKRICFMPQHFSANAALTVFDVVMMAHKQLRGWRVSGDDMQTVAAVLAQAGIGHLSAAYVSELSGGQSQMVSVAQALIRRSDVYLFDEPTSALDLRHQLDVLTRMKSVMAERQAIGIVALHDLNLAARYADHLILLGQGRILAQGPADKVLRSDAISQTYKVEVETSSGPRKDLTVHAYAT